MDQPAGMPGLLYALSGYLLLQVMLNLIILRMLRRSGRDPRKALTATFWSGVINACYLGACGWALWRSGVDSVARPEWPLAQCIGLGVAAGIGLWWVCAWARKLGLGLFGKARLIAAEDAILRVPPARWYVGTGILNLSLVQPFGRELFFRGAMLPLLAAGFGWPIALAAVLLVELLLKLNVVWVFAVIANTLILSGLYYITGSVITCISAAVIAGFIHALALNRVTMHRRSGGEA